MENDFFKSVGTLSTYALILLTCSMLSLLLQVNLKSRLENCGSQLTNDVPLFSSMRFLTSDLGRAMTSAKGQKWASCRRSQPRRPTWSASKSRLPSTIIASLAESRKSRMAPISCRPRYKRAVSAQSRSKTKRWPKKCRAGRRRQTRCSNGRTICKGCAWVYEALRTARPRLRRYAGARLDLRTTSWSAWAHLPSRPRPTPAPNSSSRSWPRKRQNKNLLCSCKNSKSTSRSCRKVTAMKPARSPLRRMARRRPGAFLPTPWNASPLSVNPRPSKRNRSRPIPPPTSRSGRSPVPVQSSCRK